MSEQPEVSISFPLPPTIDSVVREHVSDQAQVEMVTRALVEREEGIADIMRVAGQSFGLLPQIVAEVFAQIHFGAPITDEHRQLVHQQFHTVIDQIRRGEDPFAQPTNDN